MEFLSGKSFEIHLPILGWKGLALSEKSYVICNPFFCKMIIRFFATNPKRGFSFMKKNERQFFPFKMRKVIYTCCKILNLNRKKRMTLCLFFWVCQQKSQVLSTMKYRGSVFECLSLCCLEHKERIFWRKKCNKRY